MSGCIRAWLARRSIPVRASHIAAEALRREIGIHAVFRPASPAHGMVLTLSGGYSSLLKCLWSVRPQMRVQVEDLLIVRFVRTLDEMRLERAARIIQEAIDVPECRPSAPPPPRSCFRTCGRVGRIGNVLRPWRSGRNCTGAKCVFSTALLIRQRY